jgi:Arylsulfatase A and related enzymes
MNTTKNIPERVIVFLIDGLHWKAPDTLNMPVFTSLLQEGTYIQKSWMIVPHHPTVGDYGKMHTCSFPNPVLQEGTLFIKTGNKMLQHMFPSNQTTAFITNTVAYASVSRGFNIAIQNPNMTDAQVVDQGIELLQRYDLRYCRLHLQTPGNEGRYLSYTSPDKPYYRNIWGHGSPYIKYIEEADQHLGKLVDYLKSEGKWETTLLIISSDQGQSEKGWHPMAEEDSGITPLLFLGPTIAKGKELSYFEHTDITPTICHLMGLEKPNQDGGAGNFVEALLEKNTASSDHPEYIKTINRQINEYNTLRAKIMLAGDSDPYYSSLISYLENELLTPEPFYHQDRFIEWHRAGTTRHLIEVNNQILERMRNELIKNGYEFQIN